MKLLKKICKTVNFTCVLFTVATFLFALMLSAMGVISETKFTVGRLYILLLFSFIAALADLIFDVKKLNTAVKIAVNFVLCYVDMYICVFVIYFNTSGMKDYTKYTAPQIIVASVAFVIAYVAVIAVKLAVKKKLESKKTNIPYTKQFTEVK